MDKGKRENKRDFQGVNWEKRDQRPEFDTLSLKERGLLSIGLLIHDFICHIIKRDS